MEEEAETIQEAEVVELQEEEAGTIKEAEVVELQEQVVEATKEAEATVRYPSTVPRPEVDQGDKVTRAEKYQQIREADFVIAAEKKVWANETKVGYLTKMEKTSSLFQSKKPKSFFFMLNMLSDELEIYVKANQTGLVGEPTGKPRSVWKYSRNMRCIPDDDLPRTHWASMFFN